MACARAIRVRDYLLIVAPREVTARDLRDVGDQRFEQIVASLVLAEHPDAERLAAPERGADVLLPATPSRRARVWQVKHYPDDIAWKKCEESLDDAIASYDPEQVVFVFPRDLSKPHRDRFEERLVKRHPDVTVKYWGLHRIQEALARHPDISIRYFGEDRGDLLPGVIRAVQQGGKELETTRDLADRAFALDAFADVADPSFEYEMSSGSAFRKPQLWEQPPFMVFHETRGDRRLSAAAWLRPEADADVSCGFTHDDDGNRAREQVREAFAAGKPIELPKGAWIEIRNAPIVAKEALDSSAQEGFEDETSTLTPGGSVDFTLRLGSADDAPRRTFAVRSVPPSKAFQRSFGCISDGLALFAEFALTELPNVELNLRINVRPVRDPAVNAAAARFMLAFFRADEVFCTAPELLPDAGLVISGADKPEIDGSVLASLAVDLALFDALTIIEERFGPIDTPDRFSRREFEEVIEAAQTLKADSGNVTFEELVTELDHQAVADFMRQTQAGRPGRHPLHVRVFGRQLQVGIAEFDMPPIRAVTTEPGSKPGKTRVRVRTEPTSVPFRLAREEPTAPAQPNSRLWTPGQGPSGLVHLGETSTPRRTPFPPAPGRSR